MWGPRIAPGLRTSSRRVRAPRGVAERGDAAGLEALVDALGRGEPDRAGPPEGLEQAFAAGEGAEQAPGRLLDRELDPAGAHQGEVAVDPERLVLEVDPHHLVGRYRRLEHADPRPADPGLEPPLAAEQ